MFNNSLILLHHNCINELEEIIVMVTGKPSLIGKS